MNKYFTLGYRLPNIFSKPLFGDRKRWGKIIDENDSCWKEWLNWYIPFYHENQKKHIGRVVNGARYRVLKEIDFRNKKVLEIGPGEIEHLSNWYPKIKGLMREMPEYVIADVQDEMLKRSSDILKINNVKHKVVTLDRNKSELPFKSEEFDIIVTFYSLEHIYPISPYLKELHRVLREGGMLVGAIPAEGGLAWGCGRFVTSRRWLKKNTSIDPDKIICWEHPNFAENVLNELDVQFKKLSVKFWPLRIPFIDLNLVIKFIYKK